jgi:hypothetical protein
MAGLADRMGGVGCVCWISDLLEQRWVTGLAVAPGALQMKVVFEEHDRTLELAGVDPHQTGGGGEGAHGEE